MENSMFMDKNTLQKVYENFMKMTADEIGEIDIKTDEFYQYCTKLGSYLMD